MKFTKEEFKAAIDAVTPFAATRSPLQILTHVKIEADGERVTFTASRADAQIQYWLEAAGEKFGICIEAQALKRFAQFCDDDVTLAVKGKRVTLEFGETKTRLSGLETVDFPMMLQADGIVAEIEWAPLADKIAFVEQFCGVNPSRPQASCVQINSTGTAIEVFATNTTNLAFESVPHIAPEFGLCIPRDTARSMAGKFKTLTVRADQVELRSDNSIALFKVSPYKPLPIRGHIQCGLPNGGKIVRKSLLDAISFVASFSDASNLRPAVRIDLGESNAVSLIGRQNEAAAPFDYSGDPFPLGAYPDDFAAFLKALDDADLKIEFDGANLDRSLIRLSSGSRVICTAPVRA